MIRASVTELRQRLAEFLARARAGEEVVVTSRGEPIARLAPLRDEREAARARMDERRCRARVGDVLSPPDVSWSAEDGRA